MKFRLASTLTAALMSAGLAHAAGTELVIATVNNGHMIEMQKLSSNFEKANPGIKLKWVTLEEGVFCGPSMVFTNVYNPRSLIERKSEYRDTLVRKGATLGANCTIVCGTTVGEFAFIGAGAVVNKDVPAYALMVGVPAKQIGWMSEFGDQLDLPLFGHGEATCLHTGERYVLSGHSVEKLPKI